MITGKYTIMRHISQYCLLILSAVLFLSVQVSAQQVSTQYFMRGIPQTGELNPAFRPDCRSFFGIPGVGSLQLKAESSSFGLGDMLKVDPETGKLVHLFDHRFDKVAFLNLMKDRNSMEAEFATSILTFGFTSSENTFVTVDIRERVMSNVFYPRDLVKLFTYGPDSAMSFDFNGLGAEMSLFNEMSVGISQKLSEKLTIGWKVKVLFGQANLQITKFDHTFTSNEEVWPIHSAIQLDAAVPFVNVVYNEEGMVDFDSTDIRDDLGVKDIPGMIINPMNFGLAADLGVDYRVFDWLQISASLVDFGRIKWKDGVHNLSSNVDYEFLGIPITSSDDGDDNDWQQAFVDSMDETFNNFTATEKAYSTWLPSKLYAGAAFYVHPKISFGVLSRTSFYKGDVRQQFTVSANLYPIRLLSTTFSYSVINNTYKNLGFGLALKAGPLNLYFISDTGPSVYFWPVDTRYVNFKMGVNFMFGCKKLNHKTYDKPLVD